MVSQKISSVRHLDAIMVLDNGALVEYGNHHALMERKGIYAELFMRELAQRNEQPAE